VASVTVSASGDGNMACGDQPASDRRASQPVRVAHSPRTLGRDQSETWDDGRLAGAVAGGSLETPWHPWPWTPNPSTPPGTFLRALFAPFRAARVAVGGTHRVGGRAHARDAALIVVRTRECAFSAFVARCVRFSTLLSHRSAQRAGTHSISWRLPRLRVLSKHYSDTCANPFSRRRLIPGAVFLSQSVTDNRHCSGVVVRWCLV
jgi:hypothetical protein